MAFPKEVRRLASRAYAQKQELMVRLQGNPGPQERDEIERLLEEIDTALGGGKSYQSNATKTQFMAPAAVIATWQSQTGFMAVE